MGDGGVQSLFFTCLSQPQLCVQVIKHLHCELEAAGEKLIPRSDTEQMKM